MCTKPAKTEWPTTPRSPPGRNQAKQLLRVRGDVLVKKKKKLHIRNNKKGKSPQRSFTVYKSRNTGFEPVSTVSGHMSPALSGHREYSATYMHPPPPHGGSFALRKVMLTRRPVGGRSALWMACRQLKRTSPVWICSERRGSSTRTGGRARSRSWS